MPDISSTVAIVGFGRSGTTWLSDIVSKASGEALLFEPWHPEVLSRSTDFSYRSSYTEEETAELVEHLSNALDKRQPVPWLLRNHLPTAVHESEPKLTQQIWDQIGVLGFKTIRATLAPDWVLDNIARRLIYVVRNPLAVVASIVRRTNFWEFGWPKTYEIFSENVFAGASSDLDEIREKFRTQPSMSSDLEKIAAMWAVTHAVAVPRLEKAGTPIIYYEDLYRRPFESARKVLDALGMQDRGILPTYLFTPAMTTMRTLHGRTGLQTVTGAPVPPDFFWRDTLSDEEQATVLRIVEDFGVELYSADAARPRAAIS
jgi:hypothetical protein